MPQHFKVHEKEYPHFITSVITYWIPVFCRDEFFRILADSLSYCTEHKGLLIRIDVTESGSANGQEYPWPEYGPIAPGVYEINPADIQCRNGSPGGLAGVRKRVGKTLGVTWRRQSWGDYRVHLRNVRVFSGWEKYPHENAFIHGGKLGRGTWGCIRVPDYPDKQWYNVGGGRYAGGLESLMMTLLKIGSPIRLTVYPPTVPDGMRGRI